MPAGLFCLYIRNMALYEKNPGNDKKEKYLLRVVQIMGPVAICAGIYSLYVYIPIILIKHKPLGWSVLNIAKTINIILLGIGLLVHYKKSVNLFSRPWIFVPILLALLFMIFKEWLYYKHAELRIIFIALGVFGTLFLISCWFYHRKKYPEEFGLKS
jgi:hypothetical protein